jgi:hypothetical protein
MFNRSFIRIILSILAVVVFGFILLGITFIFNFLVFQLIDLIFPPGEVEPNQWFPLIRHGVFLIIIGLISWPIFKSRLATLIKAIYMTVPVAVFLATLGIFSYQWPVILYPVGTISILLVLFYFYRTKKPWLYYYSVILVSISLMIFTLSGGEI